MRVRASSLCPKSLDAILCAYPSMDGARLRQLSLSKIVPYDFVEPTARMQADSIERFHFGTWMCREMARL